MDEEDPSENEVRMLQKNLNGISDKKDSSYFKEIFCLLVSLHKPNDFCFIKYFMKIIRMTEKNSEYISITQNIFIILKLRLTQDSFIFLIF